MIVDPQGAAAHAFAHYLKWRLMQIMMIMEPDEGGLAAIEDLMKVGHEVMECPRHKGFSTLDITDTVRNQLRRGGFNYSARGLQAVILGRPLYRPELVVPALLAATWAERSLLGEEEETSLVSIIEKTAADRGWHLVPGYLANDFRGGNVLEGTQAADLMAEVEQILAKGGEQR